MYAVSGRTTWADGVVIEGVGTSDGCSVAVSLMSAAMFSNTVFEASRLEKSSIPETLALTGSSSILSSVLHGFWSVSGAQDDPARSVVSALCACPLPARCSSSATKR